MPITVVHGPTAQEILTLRWDYPVYVSGEAGQEKKEGQTYAKAARKALPREQALAELAGDDPRPLLVLRECEWCEGSDDALLSTRLDNAKTILMSSWFHAVKLPNHVLTDDHPFRNTFEEKEPAHLFLCAADGRNLVPLSGQQSQTELWNAMASVLADEHGVDVERVVSRVYKLLDGFDTIDAEEARLRRSFDEELEQRGPKSSKIKSIRRDLDEADADRKALREEFDELMALGDKRGR